MKHNENNKLTHQRVFEVNFLEDRFKRQAQNTHIHSARGKHTKYHQRQREGIIPV